VRVANKGKKAKNIHKWNVRKVVNKGPKIINRKKDNLLKVGNKKMMNNIKKIKGALRKPICTQTITFAHLFRDMAIYEYLLNFVLEHI
jgi:hypothetical protein